MAKRKKPVVKVLNDDWLEPKDFNEEYYDKLLLVVIAEKEEYRRYKIRKMPRVVLSQNFLFIFA